MVPRGAERWSRSLSRRGGRRRRRRGRGRRGPWRKRRGRRGSGNGLGSKAVLVHLEVLVAVRRDQGEGCPAGAVDGGVPGPAPAPAQGLASDAGADDVGAVGGAVPRRGGEADVGSVRHAVRLGVPGEGVDGAVANDGPVLLHQIPLLVGGRLPGPGPLAASSSSSSSSAAATAASGVGRDPVPRMVPGGGRSRRPSGAGAAVASVPARRGVGAGRPLLPSHGGSPWGRAAARCSLDRGGGRAVCG